MRSAACSSPQTRLSWCSAALLAPYAPQPGYAAVAASLVRLHDELLALLHEEAFALEADVEV